MGCDIHLFSEVKIKGEWYCHSTPNIERWYAMFSKMAGVRQRDEEIEPICLPKGLPNDLSAVVKSYHEYWSGDAHSESWFTSQEIEQLEIWLKEQHKQNNPEEYFYPEKMWGYLFGSSYGSFHKDGDPCIEVLILPKKRQSVYF